MKETSEHRDKRKCISWASWYLNVRNLFMSKCTSWHLWTFARVRSRNISRCFAFAVT